MTLRWVRGDVGGNVLLPCGLLHLGGRLIGSVVHVRWHSVTFVHACFLLYADVFALKNIKNPKKNCSDLFKSCSEI